MYIMTNKEIKLYDMLNVKSVKRFYKDGSVAGKRCNCNDECPPDMICVNGVCVPAEKSYNIKEDKHTGLYLTYEVFYD